VAILIREAQPSDAEALIEHTRRILSEPEPTNPESPEEFNPTVEQRQKMISGLAASSNSVLLIAEDGGMLVGELSCQGIPRQALQHCVTLGMSVNQEWRKRGVGSRLLEEAIAWAQGTGIVKRIELYVYARNQPAIRLYTKFGFELEGRRRRAIFHDGEYIDDLLMARLL
jgi:RimJ/RimL family protein N-acetyltransferase